MEFLFRSGKSSILSKLASFLDISGRSDKIRGMKKENEKKKDYAHPTYPQPFSKHCLILHKGIFYKRGTTETRELSLVDT